MSIHKRTKLRIYGHEIEGEIIEDQKQDEPESRFLAICLDEPASISPGTPLDVFYSGAWVAASIENTPENSTSIFITFPVEA